MSKKKHTVPGYTAQGVRDLGTRPTRRVELPGTGGIQCDHHGTVSEVDATNGISQCRRCKQSWSFDGDPI